MATIAEGAAVIVVPRSDKLSRQTPVFYNPIMKHNRDISIFLLRALTDTNLRVALPFAASGVRGIRFLQELPASKIRKICFNDKDKMAVSYMKKNLLRNKVSVKKTEISNNDANLFLRAGQGYDYIDLDPFGGPNQFLDSAVACLSRHGILAVTSTDTAALCGTYQKACLRKYWAHPLHNHCMREIGLRILIRKLQLIAAQYSRALAPIFSYSKDHYFRVFLRLEKGKSLVDSLLKQHGLFESAGPMWLGSLWERKIANRIAKLAAGSDKKLMKITKTIAAESKISAVGFADLHRLGRTAKIPKTEMAIAAIRRKGYMAELTHFSAHGIRSDAPPRMLLKTIKNT